MTAMTQYLIEAHISDLHASRRASGRTLIGNLLVETAQVLRGALLPVSGTDASLGRCLRQDMGLR